MELYNKPFTIVNNPTYSHRIGVITKKGITNTHSGIHVVCMNSKQNIVSFHSISRYDNNKNRTRFETNQIDLFEVCSSVEYIDTVLCAPCEGEWDIDSCHVLSPSLQKNPLELHYKTNSTCVFKMNEPYTFDQTKFELGMMEYKTLKKQLLNTNISLVSVGVLIIYIIQDIEHSYAFLFGGVTGLIYLILLGKETDTIANSRNWLLIPLFSSGMRLLFIAYISVQYISSDHAILLPFVLGFFMYKLAVYLNILLYV